VRRNRLTDEQLLAATCAGDAVAFSVFYARHERSVLTWLYRRTGDAELAADIAAEAFASALDAADRFDSIRAGGSSAAPWLLAIAHNALASAARRGRVATEARARLGMLEPLILTDPALERIEELGGASTPATDALAALPDEQRAAVSARVVEEREYADIAELLQCSELVVRKRVSRGLQTLRRQVKETT
jgi:RNA polymerase sigma-70 factor (ECF subfamily)